jgi:plasmid stabilization system protein ParE
VPRKYEVIWTDTAVRDLDSILEYVAARDGVGAAIHLYEKLTERIDGLSTTPARCRVVPEVREIGVAEFRELLVGPFRIPIKIVADKVILVGVLNGRGDLGEILVERALER